MREPPPHSDSSAGGPPPAPPPDSPPRDFASLYRATLSPLRRYLARLLGNTTEAQDVAHDAYLRVYPSVENQTAEKPEALLYVTARRLAINHLKRRSISPEGTAGSADPAHDTTASASSASSAKPPASRSSSSAPFPARPLASRSSPSRPSSKTP